MMGIYREGLEKSLRDGRGLLDTKTLKEMADYWAIRRLEENLSFRVRGTKLNAREGLEVSPRARSARSSLFRFLETTLKRFSWLGVVACGKHGRRAPSRSVRV